MTIPDGHTPSFALRACLQRTDRVVLNIIQTPDAKKLCGYVSIDAIAEPLLFRAQGSASSPRTPAGERRGEEKRERRGEGHKKLDA